MLADFRKLPKKQKVLAIVAVLAIAAAGSSLLFANNSPQTQENPDTAGLSAKDKKFYADNDKKKDASIKAVLGVINNVFVSQRKPFPTATEEGWNQVIEAVPMTESFFDPYTDNVYGFASEDTNPGYGQIQYAPGKTCKKDHTLTKGFGDKSLALRAKFSDGYRCVTNYQGEQDN